MNNLRRGFSLRIFLPDGIPDGVRIVEKSNWIGRGIVCPRSRFKDVRGRPEFNRTGVYVLIGPSQNSELPIVYIGEGDPALDRLVKHFANKDFWTSLILFGSKDDNLNKAHVQFLESCLCTLAKDANRSLLDNAVSPQLPSLSEPDVAEMNSFLDEMLLIFPVLGISVFEKPQPTAITTKHYFLRAKGIEARGYEDPEGFVVLAGSQLFKDFTPSAHAYLQTLRNSLIERGVITESQTGLQLTQDYRFDSPSTAAGVLLGAAANGREMWKDENGISLKDNQTRAVNDQ